MKKWEDRQKGMLSISETSEHEGNLSLTKKNSKPGIVEK